MLCDKGARVIDEHWVQSNCPELTKIRRIGKGGQKIVFAATHPDDGDVVLKAILNPDGDERIQREVLAVQHIQCPRVPRVFGTGFAGNTLWIREERVHGESLRDVLKLAPIADGNRLIKIQLHLLEAL